MPNEEVTQEEMDAAMFADMELQLRTAKAAIVYWQYESYRRDVEIAGLRMTTWAKFKKWLRRQWDFDIYDPKDRKGWC